MTGSAETILFLATMVLYSLGGLVLIWEFVRERQEARSGMLITCGGFALHSTALVLRWLYTGYAPMTNLYESLSFFSWGTVLMAVLVRWQLNTSVVAASSSPIYVMLMVLAYRFVPDEPGPLMPALRSWLLPVHVVLSFLGMAWFVLGLATALLYLIRARADERGIPSRLPSADFLDALSYRSISLGYPLYTLGALILGMVWAHQAWGRYWGWDPKEVWALVTFLVYSLYLHGRYRWGWRGRVSAYLAIIGFAVTMFTFLGVNLLLSGLHSYAT